MYVSQQPSGRDECLCGTWCCEVVSPKLKVVSPWGRRPKATCKGLEVIPLYNMRNGQHDQNAIPFSLFSAQRGAYSDFGSKSLTTCQRAGVRHSQVNTRPGQRCTTACNASSVEFSRSVDPADARSAPHRNHRGLPGWRIDDGRGLSAACTAHESITC